MGYETATQGLGATRNFYGPRDNNEGTEGSHKTFGTRQQKVLDISDQSITDNVFAVSLAFLPVGALVVAAFVDTGTVFNLGGTTPSIVIGTEGSEVTNGVIVAEAAAETLGVTDITASLTGTWAAALAAQTQIGVALEGDTVFTTAVGQMRVTIEYVTIL
jgi:hypothetical protein